MSISYHVGIDGDDDGFVCLGVQPGDALNLLPMPVSYAALPRAGLDGATVTLREDETDYGLYVVAVQTSASAHSGVRLGGGAAIPVLAEATYTAVAWVRGVSGYNSVPLAFNVRNQGAVLLHTGGAVGMFGAGWTRITRTFTTATDSTHIRLDVVKADDPAALSFEAAGWMLVAGDTAPEVFNSGAASNADDDITQTVIALEWRLGMAQPYDSTAAPVTARVTLRNMAQDYSPETGIYPALQPGRLLQIRSDDGHTRRIHFTGVIRRVVPLPGEHSPRTAIIEAHGTEAQLMGQRVRLPPQISRRADEIINALLDAVPLRRRGLQGRWLVGAGALGASTILAGVTIFRDLQAGRSVFAYVGDTWGAGIPALDAVRELAEAERGRFFVDRQGRAVFCNRHHLLTALSPAATFADNMDGLRYDYGAEVISQVQVRLIPRSLGIENAVLWTLDSPQLIPAGALRRITVRFRDDDRRPVGALNVAPLRPGVDYQMNSREDGSGADLSHQVSVGLAEVSFSAAVLEIHNTSGRAAYLLPGLQVRGQPVLQGDPALIEQTDALAQALYGPRALLLSLPALDSAEQADQIARYELARRQQPRGTVHSLTLSSRQHLSEILARTLFDRISITEAQTDHSAGYFIVAEAHQVTQGGLRHSVTWTLESAGDGIFWLLDAGHLNDTTSLAF